MSIIRFENLPQVIAEAEKEIAQESASSPAKASDSGGFEESLDLDLKAISTDPRARAVTKLYANSRQKLETFAKANPRVAGTAAFAIFQESIYELIKNSFDAKATSIQLDLPIDASPEEASEETIAISYKDNGPGFPKEGYLGNESKVSWGKVLQGKDKIVSSKNKAKEGEETVLGGAGQGMSQAYHTLNACQGDLSISNDSPSGAVITFTSSLTNRHEEAVSKFRKIQKGFAAEDSSSKTEIIFEDLDEIDDLDASPFQRSIAREELSSQTGSEAILGKPISESPEKEEGRLKLTVIPSKGKGLGLGLSLDGLDQTPFTKSRVKVSEQSHDGIDRGAFTRAELKISIQPSDNPMAKRATEEKSTTHQIPSSHASVSISSNPFSESPVSSPIVASSSNRTVEPSSTPPAPDMNSLYSVFDLSRRGHPLTAAPPQMSMEDNLITDISSFPPPNRAQERDAPSLDKERPKRPITQFFARKPKVEATDSAFAQSSAKDEAEKTDFCCFS